jgi:Zn-dependent protease
MAFPLARHRARRQAGAPLVWRGQVHMPNGRVVELNLHPTWLMTLAGITVVLALALLPRMFPAWLPAAHWGVAIGVVLIDGVIGLAHELGHALAALAKGRLVYSITLYGLAATVTRARGQIRPRDQAAIAIAGPVAHLLLAAALLAVWQLLPGDNEPLRVATGFAAVSNLAGGAFNLLPVQPLDGGRAIRAVGAVVLRGQDYLESPLTGVIIWRKRSES